LLVVIRLLFLAALRLRESLFFFGFGRAVARDLLALPRAAFPLPPALARFVAIALSLPALLFSPLWPPEVKGKTKFPFIPAG
jgi:hypothetical protein